MDSKDIVEHPLSLKVMRLTSPTLSSPIVVTCDTKDLPGNLLNASLKYDITSVSGAESIAIGQYLLVPQSFGSIYLGESFACYICVHNDSSESVLNVVLKVDLQTTSQRLTLVEGRSNDNLKSNQTLDQVIQHEVKEIGTHILVCEVIYSNGLSFRKFFKFQVLKPLDVKTKFYIAEFNQVFLETQIQNIALGPICLEKVELEASDFFTVSDLSSNKSESSTSFYDVNVLDKDASRQYLYCLTAKPESFTSKMRGEPLTVGSLDIVWRSNLGQRGHLQTSPLQTKFVDVGDIRLSLTELPNIVFLEEPFRLVCRILNISNQNVNITLCLEEIKKFSWCEIGGKLLPNLEPSKHIDISLNLIPLDIGLQVIGGIRLRDNSSQQIYEFNNLAQVFVIQR